MTMAMDAVDRRIVNALQDGLPVCERPFLAVAAALDLDEGELIARLDALLADGTLSRFGPLFDAEKLGGAFTLAAMQVPAAEFDRVAAQVNALPAVAHNYARDHALNMWFVMACVSREDIPRVLADIEAETGCTVYDFPREAEYFIELKLSA